MNLCEKPAAPPEKPAPTPTMSTNDGLVLRPEPHTIQSLFVFGTGYEARLPPDKDVCTIGRAFPPTVDVHLPAHGAERVSTVHATLQHQCGRLHVQDAGSTNGIYVNGLKWDSFRVGPGDVFVVANVPVFGVDARLHSLRTMLSRYLGLCAHVEIDEALQAIVTRKPLALAGPRRCGQVELATAVQSYSCGDGDGSLRTVAEPPRSVAEAYAILRESSRRALLIDLDETPFLPAFFVEPMFSSPYRVLPIVSASSMDLVNEIFAQYAWRFHHIKLPPLAERPGDIAVLLTQLFRDQGSHVTAQELGPDVVAALAQHDWPNNLDSLRIAARYLLALHASDGAANAAAARVGVSPPTISKWLKRVGLAANPPWRQRPR